MPTHIQAPDGQVIEFPDTMKDAEIEAAMAKLYPAPKQQPAAQPSALSRFATGVKQATIDPLMQMLSHPVDTFKAAAKDPMSYAPAFFPPLALANQARGLVEPIARDVQQGNLAGAGGRLAGNALSVAVPELAGKGMQAAARPLVKTALRLPGRAEAYGANPAKAVLEETHGIRPSTIAQSAKARLGQLNTELEGKAAAAPNPVSLQPARNVVESKINTARGFNSAETPTELAPMQNFLTKANPGFSGLTTPTGDVAPLQPAPQFLGMKRQFDTDFIRNWNPAVSTKGRLGVARQAYGAMADEFNKAVPGAEPLNQRISSLIPAAERARLTDLNAGLGERVLSRISRPTGGMLPALLGFHEGGIPGAMLGMTGAETAASPVPLMMGARTSYGVGKGLTTAAPAIPGLVNLRKRQETE